METARNPLSMRTESSHIDPILKYCSLEPSITMAKTSLPIEKLKVNGVGNVKPSSTNSLIQNDNRENQEAAKQPSIMRRYEFLRSKISKLNKPSSPAFVVEGRKVSSKLQTNGELTLTNSSTDLLVDRQELDSIDYLETKAASKGPKSTVSTVKSKAETAPHAKINGSTCNSVVLPMLYIEGPGYQMRCKSNSLPDDQQQQAEMDDSVTDIGPAENICPDAENSEPAKTQRAIKKNNFFAPRMGEDFSDLCVESLSHKSKTITLQLSTQNGDNKAKYSILSPTKSSKSSYDKLYRSANSISPYGSKISFHSVSSYLNFNTKRPVMYNSDINMELPYHDSVLQPIENGQTKAVRKKLVTKSSDVELDGVLKVRSVK